MIKSAFIIEAYTRRMAERHLHLDGTLHYDTLQKIFMDALPPEVVIYNEYHALIVALCKESCRKSKCGKICKKITTFYEIFSEWTQIVHLRMLYYSKSNTPGDFYERRKQNRS